MYLYVITVIVIIVLFWLIQKYYKKNEGYGGFYDGGVTGLKPYIPPYSTTLQRRFGMASVADNFSSGDVGKGTFWAGVQKPSYA